MQYVTSPRSRQTVGCHSKGDIVQSYCENVWPFSRILNNICYAMQFVFFLMGQKVNVSPILYYDSTTTLHFIVFWREKRLHQSSTASLAHINCTTTKNTISFSYTFAVESSNWIASVPPTTTTNVVDSCIDSLSVSVLLFAANLLFFSGLR